MERQILHMDMDAFFAAVEQLDNPDYRGKPVIVGGDPHGRGVVSTCSYEARKFGIHSAMPSREAYARCPEGIFLWPRGARYAEISRAIMGILAQYTPLVEPLSLDEAFLDLTGSERIFGPAVEIGRTIVRRIQTEIGLSASVGIAPNKFLAKLASDLRKPAGFVVIARENVRAVLEDLPVGKLWGVGVKTEEQLLQMGIKTIGALSRVDPEILSRRFGDQGIHLYRLAHGYDDRKVEIEQEAKSIGHEITFPVDTDDRAYLAAVLLWQSDQVARRLRRHSLQGRVVTVKLRDSHFKTITRRITLAAATDFEETIYQTALGLAGQADWGGGKVRLIGVSVSGFAENSPLQLGLFSTPGDAPGGKPLPEGNAARAGAKADAELAALHRAVDGLRDRFGEGIITKGSILQAKEDKKNPRLRERDDA